MLTKAASRKRAQRSVPMPTACEKCGVSGVKLERHHHDYQRPTDVIVVCCRCHAAIEAGTGQRPTRPVKTCAICAATFSEYTHSRVKTCGRSCLSEMGRRNAAKRWGRRVTASTRTDGPQAVVKPSTNGSRRASRKASPSDGSG